MCTLFRRLLIVIFLLWGVCAWAQSLNTVPVGQGSGFPPKGVPIPTGCSQGINYPSTNNFVCAPTLTATPSATPTNTLTATPSATPTGLVDTYFAGQGVGNPSAYNGPFANCPYGSAYSTSSHNFACVATPTVTATITATPSATPTALANTVLQGQGVGSDPLYEPVAICTTGLASRYSAQNTWTCAPIPATPTPTTSATPTTTATPTATPTFAAHAFLVGQDSAIPKALALLTNGQLAVGSTGADPVPATVGTGTGISTSTGAGSLTINNTGVTSNVATANQTSVSAATGAVTVGLAGPHNFTTQTIHGVLLGQTSSAITATAAGASNTVLHGNTGADPTYSAVDLTADVTNTLTIGKGGTGVTTGSQSLVGGTTAATTISTTNGVSGFIPINGGAYLGTEGNVQGVTPASFTISRMYCHVRVAPGASNSYLFAFRVNGASSTLTCSTGNTTDCNDTTHTVTVVGGTDLVNWITTTTIGGGAATAVAGGCIAQIAY